MRQKKIAFLVSLTLAFGLMASACSPRIDVRGNLIDQADLNGIENSKLSKNDIVRRFGTPTNVATFNTERWYYVGSKTASLAFFRPKLLEQQVVAFSFDKNGFVSQFNVYKLEDGKIIDPVRRITPTEGKELSFLEELFGNFGRFNPQTQ
ncbi:MAG TPA: outer membrane protein assembly factor BamE [Alphaproteobacteria bacterium]|nr:outer membrane protein assembly factor BamE [Alphaproteobacteria bacterium]